MPTPATAPTTLDSTAQALRALLSVTDGNEPSHQLEAFADGLTPQKAQALWLALQDRSNGLQDLLARRVSSSTAARFLQRVDRRRSAASAHGDPAVADRGTGLDPAGDRGTGDRGSSARERGVVQNPLLIPLCRKFQVDSVPQSYAEFEQAIMARIARCVKSRSDNAHREIDLVMGNESLKALHKALTPNKPALVIPTYVWGPDRVESIRFSSPDMSSGPNNASAVPPPSRQPGPVHEAAKHDETAKRDYGPRDIQVRPPRRDVPERSRPDLPVVDEASDLVDDAKKLIDVLRREGRDDEAKELEGLVTEAAKWLAAVGALVGVYIFAVRFRAGALLFQWGWNAWDGYFERALARAMYPQDELRDALRDIVKVSKPLRDLMGGSGIDWKVLDEVIDGTISVQIDKFACGPACIEMLLRDRGINVLQSELVKLARLGSRVGIKKATVAIDVLATILNEYDPAGNWMAGELTIPGATKLQVFKAACKTGSWIAYVDGHFVVVDGLDKAGAVLIRDPWPGGTRYRVLWDIFLTHWSEGGAGVIRQGR